MKKLLSLLMLGAACMTMSAQEKVEETVAEPTKATVQDNYERNSLSLIIVDRGDKRDKEVAAAISSINLGGKFDLNKIATTHILCEGDRHEGAAPEPAIATAISGEKVAKQIISYWYMRTDDGTFSAERLMERGLYNAGDEEIDMAAMSAVGSDNAMELLGSMGDVVLLDNSYVMVLDISKIEKSETSDHKPQWSVTTTANVYKLAVDDEFLQSIYDAAVWADEVVGDETRASMIKAYDALPFAVSHCATASCITTREEEKGGVNKAIKDSYETVLAKLENQIAAWQVTSYILEVKPIRAAIGLKEGLKNGKRYKAYETVADDEGNEKSKSRGYMRATTIGDNREVAQGTGSSVTSEFYQISGVRNVEPNYLLKQSNDLAMGVGVGYKMGAFGGVNITLDYLASIKTGGSAIYGLVDIAIDGELCDDDVFKTSQLSDGVSFIYAGVGAGYSIRPIRPLEIMGYAMVGMDYMSLTSEAGTEYESEEEEDEAFLDYSAYTGAVGARANLTLAYPFMLFADVNYTMLLSEGVWYEYYNEELELADLQRKSGLSFSIGAKYIF